MIERDNKEISISKQSTILGIYRSGLYYKPCKESAKNIEIMEFMDKLHIQRPCYGVRRIREELRKKGYSVGRKLIARLMRIMCIEAIYPRPSTTEKNSDHKIYPYLLKGLKIERPNQVWETDITYIPMKRGFMYMMAIIDVYSRYVVGWSVSNSMEAEWCVGVVEEAIKRFGKPEIMNTDQGSQFTSRIFTEMLTQQGVKISMDSKGRAIDNIYIERLWRSVKQENIYLHAYETGTDLYKGMESYFDDYNNHRVHQSLDYSVPIEVYKKAS